MTNEPKDQYSQTTENYINRLISASLSQKLLCKVGYGLILFSLFDLLSIIYPPQFTNPFWELGFIQTTVERIVVPIIGFALIFINGPVHRKKAERIILRILSWLTLLIFLSLIPLTALTLSSAIRIDQQNNQQLTRQKQQSLNELQALQQELSALNNAADLTSFVNQLQTDDQPIQVAIEEFVEMKQDLSESLAEQVSQIQSSAANDLNEQRKTLIKKTVRVLIGLFITGAIFFSIWKETKWARE